MHHSIDITKLAPAAAHPLSTFDHVLHRLQNLTLPEAGLQKHQQDGETLFVAYPKAEERTVIDTFAPRHTGHNRSPASSQSSSDAEFSSSSSYSASQPASPTAAAHEAFYVTRSRVVRLYNLPPMTEAFLSRVFLPQNAEHRAHIPIPATLWELRDEVAAGRRASSVWAVFRTHEEACAALTLSGRAMSVATALESDLEPFHKLHRVLLTPAPTPTLPPLRHIPLDLPPPPPRMPELSAPPSTGEYTLSSNPPNPKTSFRLGDWICPSPKCAAHNFGRNLACIGCGCPRSAVNGGNASAHPHNQQHQHQHAFNQTGGGALLGQGARGMPSPRFTNNANGNGVNGVKGINGNNNVSSGVTTYYSSGPAPAAPPNFQTKTQQTQQNHPQLEQHDRVNPHHQQHNQQHQPFNAVFTQMQNSSSAASHALQACGPPSSSASSSSTISIHAPHAPPPAPVKAAAASASSSSAHPLLTPSGRAFAVGGKVQNISSDPLSPCVMYWPDNEPFPEQGQIRPSCMAGIAPPILNTGNRGPISHQPGDWICQKCNYLNWRRRKVCQTCLPYAEGNGDSISAAVQAERIALLTSVLSQTSLNGGGSGGSALDSPISVHGHGVTSAHGLRSHSLTPPQSRRPFIDLPSVPGHHVSHAQGSLQVPPLPSHLGVGAGHTLNRPVHRSQSHFALGQQYHNAAPVQQNQFQQLHQQQLQQQRQQQPQQQISPYTTSSPIYQTSGHHQPSPIFSTGPDAGRMHQQAQPQQQPQQQGQAQQHLSVHHSGRATGLGFNAASNTINNGNGNAPFSQAQLHGLIQAPAPLLPSFLQDIVQSPALSPTSTTTSSAELSSIEEYDEQLLASPPGSAQQGMFGGPRARGDSGSTTSDAVSGGGASPLANIWRLDGEESKSLSAFPLPNHQELVGAQARAVSRGDVGLKMRA